MTTLTLPTTYTRHGLNPWTHLTGFILALGLTLGQLPAAIVAASAPAPAAPLLPIDAQPANNATHALPLAFVPNSGQYDPTVRFQAQGGGGTLAFADTYVGLALPNHQGGNPALLRLHFDGGNNAAEIVGLARLPGTANFFQGNQTTWQSGIATYKDILYRNIYPGVDIHYTGSDGVLKSTYLVAPASDPASIRLRYEGITQLGVDAGGKLTLTLPRSSATTPAQVLTESAPVAWQQIGRQRVYVDVRYALQADGSVGFAVGSYNPAFQLTIDPALVYGTYLGGAGDDRGYSVAVDSVGNVYVAGTTFSTQFPGPGITITIGTALSDVFVTKIISDGSAIAYTTIIGGNNNDSGAGIAINKTTGEAYVVGDTLSSDFPVTNTSILTPGIGSGRNAFLTKLTSTGAFSYSALLGGDNTDTANRVTVDGNGRAIIVGATASLEASLPYPPASIIGTRKGGDDVFVAAATTSGSLSFFRLLGGTVNDAAYGVAVDGSNNIYLTGQTNSPDYNVTFGSLQTTKSAGVDAFVSKLDPTGNSLIYSTFLGRDIDDYGYALAVNPVGNASITGQTTSNNFYVQNGIQSTRQGTSDAFVTTLNVLGSAVLYSTYLGGDGQETGRALALDSKGNLYVVGESTSAAASFNLLNQFPTSTGSSEAFAIKITSAGALDYGTYLGGSGFDAALGVAVDDNDGSVYVTGYSDSSNLYTVGSQPPLRPNNASNSFDAFVSKLGQPVVSVGSASVVEGTGPGTTLLSFPITTTITSTENITLTYSTVPSTATDADFTPVVSGTAVIAANEITATLIISVTRDAIDEPDEQFSVNIDNVVSAVFATNNGPVIGAIQDDDDPPSVAFSTDSQSVDESAGTAPITVTLPISSSFPITVSFVVSDTSTATGGVDYSLGATDIVIPPGSLSSSGSLSIGDDLFDEVDETIVLSITDALNASIGLTATQTITISDNDAAPTVSFSLPAQTVNESAGSIPITATLSVTSSKQITVPLSIAAASTATNIADYSLGAAQIIIPPGSPTGTVAFSVVSDALDEPDETVVLSITNPVDATVGATGIQTITIQDNNPTPIVSFSSATQAVSESVGTMLITAALDIASSQPVTMPFSIDAASTATNIADYNLGVAQIVIPAGSITGTITLTVNNDLIDESDETVIISATGATNANLGAPGMQTITIQDDDNPPSISFTLDSQSVGEAAGSIPITATLSISSSKNIIVPLTIDPASTATNGIDYSLSAAQFTIPAGSITGTITLTVNNDGSDEFDETAVLSMTNPVNATIGATGVQTVTILDDDNAPNVSFTTAAQSVSEGIGNATAAVSLSIRSGKPITVPFTVGGTATNGSDYTLAPGNILVNPGSLTGTLTFSITNDPIDENDETVVITAIGATNANLVAPSTQTITITDNDNPPLVSFTSATQSVSESDGNLLITATLNISSSKQITVPLTIGAASSASGADYDLPSAQILFVPGTLTGTTSLSIINDTIDEDDETVVLSMTGATNATIGSPGAQTVTIVDDDAAPDVSFTTAAQTAGEADGSLLITATLSFTSSRLITVPLTIAASSSAAAADYSLPSPQIVIAPDSPTGTVTLSITNDTFDEFDETVALSITNPINASLGATGVQTVTIVDDDAPPTVSFNTSAQTVNEGVGTAMALVSLSVQSGKPITVPFTVGGTATGGTDHNLAAGQITIAPGNSTGNISFNLINDTLDEPDETVVITLTGATDATVGIPSTQTITVTDNDLPTATFIAATQSVSESVGSGVVTATLGNPAFQDASIPFTVSGSATAGADHNLVAGTITIPTGSITGTTSFSVADDLSDENDETVIVTLGTPTNATLGTPNVQTITILDNDAPPTLSFSTDSQTVSEGIGAVTLTVDLDIPSGKPISVPFTVGGTATSADHNLTSGLISVALGSSSGSVSFNVRDDLIDEDDETVILTLAAPTNATLGLPDTQTITISDNDAPPSVGFTTAAQTVGENAGTVTLAVSLSIQSAKPITVPFTVGGTATGGADHDLVGGSFFIPAGSTSANVSFNLTDDTTYEPRETVVVTLDTPTNATLRTPSAQTVTITDNDGPTVSFSKASDSVAESINTYAVTVQLGQPAVVGEAISVTFAADPSSTAGNADYSLPSQPLVFSVGEQTKSFNLTIVNDQLDEADETLVLALSVSTGSNARPGNPTGLTLTITDDDETPLAVNDSYATNEDTVLSVSAAQGVLANDSDGDGDPISATLVSGTTNGTLALKADGSFVYTPTLNFNGSDSFSYRGSDPGGNLSGLATVTITVAAINDAPEAANDQFRVEISSSNNTLNVLANDRDIENDALTISAVTQPTNGSVTIGTGNVSYTPQPGFDGVDRFTYTISDGHGGSDTATVLVTVGKYRQYISLFATGVGIPPAGLPDLATTLQVVPGNPVVGQPAAITVIVTNTGTARSEAPFWVDFYVNPRVVPTVNRPFNEVCPELPEPCLGIAWLVTQGLLPGQSVTLTSVSSSYVVSNTVWRGGFETPGTKMLYVFVDSWNRAPDGTPRNPAGAIVESNEANNIRGLKLVVTFPATTSETTTEGLPLPESLPPRRLPGLE